MEKVLLDLKFEVLIGWYLESLGTFPLGNPSHSAFFPPRGEESQLGQQTRAEWIGLVSWSMLICWKPPNTLATQKWEAVHVASFNGH